MAKRRPLNQTWLAGVEHLVGGSFARLAVFVQRPRGNADRPSTSAVSFMADESVAAEEIDQRIGNSQSFGGLPHGQHLVHAKVLDGLVIFEHDCALDTTSLDPNDPDLTLVHGYRLLAQ